jgi:hypothetical protein
MNVSQSLFDSRRSLQTLRNVWSVPFERRKLCGIYKLRTDGKVHYTFADLLELPQHMAYRILIYQALRKINLRRLHFVKQSTVMGCPRVHEVLPNCGSNGLYGLAYDGNVVQRLLILHCMNFQKHDKKVTW